ncbi:alpha-E domain-containing protein [Paraliomyxa miuraensis]|uniref:alpha-E domain-containing protein n=1 Tax=Paraliomyxa miuraensis TaxID=376150 RepID=UPI0022527791|nr:alpha-E domain-containing protein [Paraliomyxa miuraensis]MCX4245354.1 alpha-E domain-containing protein [Paraliomyxa miuraensis]
MLISRVADHCFWFGRYLERAEATARSLGSTREALMGADLEERQSWLPIVIAGGEQERFEEHFVRADPNVVHDGERVQEYMVWDDRNPSSLRASIAAVRANARSIRDHLSLEVWSQINELHWWIERPLAGGGATGPVPHGRSDCARQVWLDDRHAFYAHIAESSALTAGLLRTTMLRDGPFDFIILGTMIERASQTARVLDVQHHALELSRAHVIVDTALWLALLRACAGYEPFMRRHRGRVSGTAVAAFLIQDPRFPRSIGFALQSAQGRLEAIRANDRRTEGPEPAGGSSQQRLATLGAWLDARSPQQLAGSSIHDVLTHVVDEVHTIASQIGVELLGYAPPPAPGDAHHQTQG